MEIQHDGTRNADADIRLFGRVLLKKIFLWEAQAEYTEVHVGGVGGGMVVHRSGDIFPRKISNLIKKNKQYIGRLACFPMKHLINKVASEGPSGLCSRRPQLIKLVIFSRSWV